MLNRLNNDLIKVKQVELLSFQEHEHIWTNEEENSNTRDPSTLPMLYIWVKIHLKQ